MAQPVFDDHPLQEYFQETGEDSEPMPGGLVEAGPSGVNTPPSALAQSILHAFSCLEEVYSSVFATKFPRRSNSFEERFKYDVISSSLLSTSLAASPNPARRHFNLDHLAASDHSRTSSTLTDHEDLPHVQKPNPTWPAEPGSVQQTVAIVSAAVVSFASGYEFLGMLLLAVALYVNCASRPTPETADFATLTLEAVNDLISCGNVWDSAVHEAMAVIEKEDRSPNTFYGSTNPHSPLSSLRVALQSSLHTTQSQCDNVRQLLAALTSPTQLAQLSEMYAPASPVKPSFSLDNPRPTSDPVSAWRRRTISMPSGAAGNKRATWNGSPRTLAAVAGMNAMMKKEHRRSDMQALFLQPQSSSSMSAPPSPLAQRPLHEVDEEADRTDPESELAYTKEEDVFGVAALDLRRSRRRSGMEVFVVPPPSYSSQSSYTLGHSRQASSTSISSPSRFTLLQTNRHPLSLSSLHLALQGALGAKRYACAHLLAMRFEEDSDDDAYWEDVRSVMALLTSTFSDASSALLAALDEAEKRRMKDERPSTESLDGDSREGSMSPDVDSSRRLSGFFKSARKMAESTSFAPMPTHLARFAAHVDAISSALKDAREHLEACVASVREDKSLEGPAVGSATDPFADDLAENPSLQAYERLRRELGYAFRECERGREKLLEVLAPPKPSSDPASDDEDEFLDAPPALAHDSGSDDSTGPDSAFLDRRTTFELGIPPTNRPSHSFDDATEHLLATATSEHLPPPGIEQIFEAYTGENVAYTRERSKLSREERIQLAKARRESGRSVSGDQSSSKGNWGPGGEVVQELKDVIWKVGEQRRKLSAKMPPPLSPPPPTPPPALTIEVTDDDDAVLYDGIAS